LHTEFDTLPLVVADSRFLFGVDKAAHLADDSRVLRVIGENDSIDAEDEADAKEDDKVSFCLCKEHVGITLDVISKVIIRNPHV
jgi:hypothetical protein